MELSEALKANASVLEVPLQASLFPVIYDERNSYK